MTSEPHSNPYENTDEQYIYFLVNGNTHLGTNGRKNEQGRVTNYAESHANASANLEGLLYHAIDNNLPEYDARALILKAIDLHNEGSIDLTSSAWTTGDLLAAIAENRELEKSIARNDARSVAIDPSSMTAQREHAEFLTSNGKVRNGFQLDTGD
jgi:hypothetical protein